MLRFLIGIMIFFSFASQVFAGPKAPLISHIPLRPDIKWLRKELRKIGLSKSFVTEALASYEPETFEKVLTLNLLGFQQPSAQHTDQITPQSVSESLKFMKQNKKSLTLAKEKYQVPGNVISALLWIETRHGENMGRFHIVSVYLHLLQSDLRQNRKSLTRLAIAKNKTKSKTNLEYSEKEIRALMVERTKKRNLWAREQLRALASIRQRKQLDLKTLRGSYAGALGLPQFIPSSYLDFAKSIHPPATANLKSPGDAIMSVAYYLSKHGWQNCNAESKITALMKYNNSRDYAESILEISKRIAAQDQHPDGRRISSTEDLETADHCADELQ